MHRLLRVRITRDHIFKLKWSYLMFVLTLIDTLPTLAILCLRLCTHGVDILIISLLFGSLHFKLTLAESLLASLPASHDDLIWNRPAFMFHAAWKRALVTMGIPAAAFPLAGLRGGGATDWILQTNDVFSLSRRGRWSNVRTLSIL